MKLRDIPLRQIRLLPVVILAAGALLLLKGTGIMTGGGYVLTGPSPVFAAGGGGHGPAATTDESGETTLALPVEPTMVNEDPVLNDGAPTLPLKAGAAEQHGAPADEEAAPAAASAAHGEEAETAEATGCPPVEIAAPHGQPAEGEHAAPADSIEGFDFI